MVTGKHRERQGCGKEAVGREAIMDCSVDGAYDIGWWTGGMPAVQLIQLIFEWMFLTVFNHYLLEKAVGI